MPNIKQWFNIFFGIVHNVYEETNKTDYKTPQKIKKTSLFPQLLRILQVYTLQVYKNTYLDYHDVI